MIKKVIGYGKTRSRIVLHALLRLLHPFSYKLRQKHGRLCLYAALIMMTFILLLNPAFAVAATIETPEPPSTINSGYLLDKSITWADGSKEHVQIDNDGFFQLDGYKRRMVGIVLNLQNMPAGKGQFYLPGNMALYEKELSFLQSTEIRVIHVNFPYVRWDLSAEKEEASYTAIMDKLYQHKMLVIPELAGKWMPNFLDGDNPDFSWTLSHERTTDSMGAWTKRLSAILSTYPNVVAVVMDNELDYKLKAQDCPWDPKAKNQTYTAETASKYLLFLKDILKSINVPVIHKLMGNRYWGDTAIKLACLDNTDLPAFDCYATDAQQQGSDLDTLFSWLQNSGHPVKGWWCMELNHGNPCDTSQLGIDHIESIFNHGASLATLYVSNSSKSSEQFFNTDGSPTAKLVEIAGSMLALQAPLTNQIDIASNTDAARFIGQ